MGNKQQSKQGTYSVFEDMESLETDEIIGLDALDDLEPRAPQFSIEEWTSMLEQTEPMSLSQDDCTLLLEAIEREPRSIEALKNAFKKSK